MSGPPGAGKTLLALPNDTIALPGHELETTIRQERFTNPFVLQALRQMQR